MSIKIPSVVVIHVRGCIQKFPDWVDNEIHVCSNKHSPRSNTKGYGGKTHHTDSQNSDTTAPSSRELYHLQFSLQSGNVWIHPRMWPFSCFMWWLAVANFMKHNFCSLWFLVRYSSHVTVQSVPEACSIWIDSLCYNLQFRFPVRAVSSSMWFPNIVFESLVL